MVGVRFKLNWGTVELGYGKVKMTFLLDRCLSGSFLMIMGKHTI
jgi:hypothetical protein